MVIRDNEVIEFESDKSNCEDMSSLKDFTNDEIAYLVKGKTLVIKGTLQVQVKENDIDHERKNVFHTHCYIQNKMCSLPIDNGSCANITNTTLVSKLNLSTIKHHRPYRLQQLNDYGEMKVTRQVLVLFLSGKYIDEIICDVVSMHANHMFLGRPWQFNRKAIYDKVRNRYIIVKDGKTITLVPFTPKYIYMMIK